MIRNLKLLRGYTLIEILVSVTILGLLFTAGYASFRDFSRRQAAVGVARTLIGDLRLAQQSALSGTKPDSSVSGYTNCLPPSVLNGYRLTTSVSPYTSYSIQADCSGGLVTTKTVNAPPGVTIVWIQPSTGAPTSGWVLFKALGQGVSFREGTDFPVSVRLQGPKGFITTQSILVTSGGEIK